MSFEEQPERCLASPPIPIVGRTLPPGDEVARFARASLIFRRRRWSEARMRKVTRNIGFGRGWSCPRLLLVAIVLAGTLSCDDYLPEEPPSDEPPPPGPAADLALTVQTLANGPRVPADFLGLGFETPVMADERLADPTLLRLLTNLGPGTWRFGG